MSSTDSFEKMLDQISISNLDESSDESIYEGAVFEFESAPYLTQFDNDDSSDDSSCDYSFDSNFDCICGYSDDEDADVCRDDKKYGYVSGGDFLKNFFYSEDDTDGESELDEDAFEDTKLCFKATYLEERLSTDIGPTLGPCDHMCCKVWNLSNPSIQSLVDFKKKHNKCTDEKCKNSKAKRILKETTSKKAPPKKPAPKKSNQIERSQARNVKKREIQNAEKIAANENKRQLIAVKKQIEKANIDSEEMKENKKEAPGQPKQQKRPKTHFRKTQKPGRV